MELNEEYRAISKKNNPKSKVITNFIRAFLGGGVICLLGQLLSFLYLYIGANEKDSYLFVTLTFIALGSVLTAIGIFDNIANIILAGILVPVTGFSNSLTSACIDAKEDGKSMGIGNKMFSVAGPVILFSSIFGSMYGFIYFLFSLIFK